MLRLILSLPGDPFGVIIKLLLEVLFVYGKFSKIVCLRKLDLSVGGLCVIVCCVLCHEDVEDHDHMFGACSFVREVHSHVTVVFSFPWPLPLTSAIQLMSKLSKRKSVKVCITVMLWTEILFQVWLKRNGRIFEGKILLPCHVAKNVLFYVASRLNDVRKASLIV